MLEVFALISHRFRIFCFQVGVRAAQHLSSSRGIAGLAFGVGNVRRAGHLDCFLQNDGRVAGFAVDEENRNRSNPAEALAVMAISAFFMINLGKVREVTQPEFNGVYEDESYSFECIQSLVCVYMTDP